MYNFFSNRLKLKAFQKALKQVEDEGFYANLQENEDTMPILPDLSKAVASLSKKEEQQIPEQVPETVNITELESSLDKQKATPGEPRPKSVSPLFKQNTETNSDSSQFYQSLFRSSPTFLTDDEMQDIEFLDGQPQDYTLTPQLSTTAEITDKVTQHKRRTFESLADRAKARRTLEEKKEEIQPEVEIPAIEADIEMPEMEKEPEPQTKPAEVKVEVVADIPEPEPPKTITKTVYVTKEVPVEVPVPVEGPKKPKAKKATSTTKKKKRKYDADISGGFNY